MSAIHSDLHAAVLAAARRRAVELREIAMDEAWQALTGALSRGWCRMRAAGSGEVVEGWVAALHHPSVRVEQAQAGRSLDATNARHRRLRLKRSSLDA